MQSEYTFTNLVVVSLTPIFTRLMKIKIKSTVYVIVDIRIHQPLTTTNTVAIAKATDTVGIRSTSSCITTFRTYITTTVHIRFILVFDTVGTCFRC